MNIIAEAKAGENRIHSNVDLLSAQQEMLKTMLAHYIRHQKDVVTRRTQFELEQAQARGVNNSLIHVDFMVGSEDLAIDGIRPDGSREPVFRNGTWA